MERVLKDGYDHFRFSVSQEKLLRDCLRRRGNKTENEANDNHFIEITNKLIGYWLATLKPEVYYDPRADCFQLRGLDLPPRGKVYRERAVKLRDAISRFRQCLLNTNRHIELSLEVEAWRAIKFESSPSLKKTLTLYQESVPPNGSIDPVRPLLLELLEFYDRAIGRVEEKYIDRGGSHKPEFVYLVIFLAGEYTSIYGKRPGVSPGTKFVNFIQTIAGIFSLSVSASLIERIVKKYTSTT